MSTSSRLNNTGAVAQGAEQGLAQGALRISDLDGALRELNAQEPGLALLVDGDGFARDVVHCDEPIPYRLMDLDFDCDGDTQPCRRDVESGLAHEGDISALGWLP